MRAEPFLSSPSKIRTEPVVDLKDYPVREYVRAMSMELAQMALWDGDPPLAEALEAVARMAGVPKVTEPARDPAPRRKRAS